MSPGCLWCPSILAEGAVSFISVAHLCVCGGLGMLVFVSSNIFLQEHVMG